MSSGVPVRPRGMADSISAIRSGSSVTTSRKRLGHHRPGRDRVDPDRGGQLQRQGLGEVVDPGLGRRIRAGEGRSAGGCARGDVDDAAACGHAGRGRLAPLERAGQVELKLGPEGLIGGVYKRSGGLLVGSADVVDPDVEATELRHGPIGQRFGEVADAALHHKGPPPPFPHAQCRGLKILEAASIDHHVAAEVGQTPSDGPPDAPPRSGDDRDPAVHVEAVPKTHPDKTNSPISFIATARLRRGG